MAESAPCRGNREDGDVAVPGGIVFGEFHRGVLFFQLSHNYCPKPYHISKIVLDVDVDAGQVSILYPTMPSPRSWTTLKSDGQRMR